MALATKGFAHSLPASGGTTVRNSLSPWVHLAAGASGGLVNSIATSPLDVLRTHMQSDTYETATRDKISNIQRLRHVHPIRETIDALGTIHRTEGIRGLCRGLVPSLIGVVPAQAIKFYVYGNCKRLGAQYLGLEEAEPLVHAQAAVAAGLATATATNPIWLVKTRLQLFNDQACDGASSKRSRSTLDCVLQIFKTEGVSGFYRGLSASYLGTLETVVHLVLYERLKTLFQAQSYYSPPSSAHRSELRNWASTAGAAGCAKVAAVLITYPHEVQWVAKSSVHSTIEPIYSIFT
ncbi:mitochondrial carrier protein (Rim2), putative [Beauveria bassiana ARSEF 2860]|uniref:Mitochondrial carrier protein (Rim2), putative n=1 Tax=Beauveria bassiana (strain ARSEF 2860) TaxID=655819 RepID=J4WB55_BEAB2|nr:mitochondrial carrier protein (Rim2), putative [Beauveria bassiana ARSEF 2860]EJP67355.1 mitochondrial carrier protein (Rim2), putative [Beauveria bassiana ARSEF 2860]